MTDFVLAPKLAKIPLAPFVCLMQTVSRWLTGLLFCKLGNVGRIQKLPKAPMALQ